MSDDSEQIERNLAAGHFSVWLDAFTRTMEGKGSGDVPCGACVGCCTSSKFVHLRPTDRRALGRIPKSILFPAPGLPDGHYLLGYDENGHCPMFQHGACSIYPDRPETCRQYDCRVFAATGVAVEPKHSAIAKQVARWAFDFSSPDDVAHHEAVQKAVAFLSRHRNGFPNEDVLRTPSGLAAFALRIYALFLGRDLPASNREVRAIVEMIAVDYLDVKARGLTSGTRNAPV